MAEAAPVRKLLNMVLLLAIKDKASDIHFEPFEEEYKMRYRVDGVLYELVPPPRHLAPAIASRIKVMSNLDIAERRLPQDGRIQLALGGNTVDIRVSTLPTHVRRERGAADPRPDGRPARPEEARHARGHAEDLARDRREAQRHHPGDRADLLGQDDDALRHAQRAEPDRGQDHHDRGAGRVRDRRPDPGADQRRDRRDVRQPACGRSCGRTRTRSWWARPATWRRPRSRSRRR